MDIYYMPPAPDESFSVLDDLAQVRFLGSLVGLVRRWGNNTRFEIDSRKLHIRGTLYGRRIRRGSLRLDEACVLDLRGGSEYTPALRTNGIGLPGYSAGWFRLESGEKALVFVTDPERVVYVPTSKGYVLLLSIDEPRAFLSRLGYAEAG